MLTFKEFKKRFNPDTVEPYVWEALEKFYEPENYTENDVVAAFKLDVEAAFNKIQNAKSEQAFMLFQRVMVWNNILENGFEKWDTENPYEQLGLPLMQAIAGKYCFQNPFLKIGGGN